jgi:hypothetical protein
MEGGQCGKQKAGAGAGAGRSASSLRGLTYHTTDTAGNTRSVPLHICLAGPPQAYAEIYGADASGVTAVETCVGAAA